MTRSHSRSTLHSTSSLCASRLVLAVPVCAAKAAQRLRESADEVTCLHAPALFRGVGERYRDFSQVSDEEVIAVLEELGDAAV